MPVDARPRAATPLPTREGACAGAPGNSDSAFGVTARHCDRDVREAQSPVISCCGLHFPRGLVPGIPSVQMLATCIPDGDWHIPGKMAQSPPGWCVLTSVLVD